MEQFELTTPPLQTNSAQLNSKGCTKEATWPGWNFTFSALQAARIQYGSPHSLPPKKWQWTLVSAALMLMSTLVYRSEWKCCEDVLSGGKKNFLVLKIGTKKNQSTCEGKRKTYCSVWRNSSPISICCAVSWKPRCYHWQPENKKLFRDHRMGTLCSNTKNTPLSSTLLFMFDQNAENRNSELVFLIDTGFRGNPKNNVVCVCVIIVQDPQPCPRGGGA